jgi:hypothetical protein
MTPDDTTTVTEIVDRPHARPRHRIVCLYSTRGLRIAARSGKPATAVLNLGRFAGHYEAHEDDMPWVAKRGPIAPAAMQWRGAAARANVHELEAYVLRLRQGRVILALRIELDGPLRNAISLLAETCFDRRTLQMKLDGRPVNLFDALLAAAPPSGLERAPTADFDRDVHQVVCAAGWVREFVIGVPGGDLGPPRKEALARYVYRSDEDFRLDYAAFRLPAELNRGAGSAAAHGRGVTVLSGIAEPVENAAILTAVQLLGAASAVREIRQRASRTLDALTALRGQSMALDQRRAVLAALSNELSEMHTELSFEVESLVDAVSVPEIVIEQYQASLAGTLGLAQAADTTSKMLDRLTAAITAAGTALERAEAEAEGERRDRLTQAFAVITALAIPLTLLLAFYGVNGSEVDERRSVFDFEHYWFYWAALVFICVVAWRRLNELKNRVSSRSQALEDEATRRLDYALDVLGLPKD